MATHSSILAWTIPWTEEPGGLQFSCLENPMDRGDWQATVHGVAKCQRQLNTNTQIFTTLPLL